jgi:Hg(II)-responsive transcriptional regulator
MDALNSSDVARAAGVNIQTLRYYERLGLLEAPPRSASGYRRFDSEAVRVVRFIKRAQELGFSLREIKELLKLRRGASPARAPKVRAAAELKLIDIDQRIRDLRSMRAALAALVDSCARAGDSEDCPILESLEADGAKGP